MAPLAVRACCAAVRWTPVVFISAIVVWSYYAYVVQMCIFTVESPAEKAIYLLFYHPVVFMFVWSYAKTIFTAVGTVPKQFYLPKLDIDRLERETNQEAQNNILIDFVRNSNLPVQNRTHNGAPRYCEKCHCIKPDRCHHCSVCGVCVLKMDHHCPWVNNCVGFTTYKFFVMFLGYALVYCVYVALTSLKYFILFWSGGVGHDMGKFHVLFLFFVAVMFAISLISLFGYHCYLTANNRSTLVEHDSTVLPPYNGPLNNDSLLTTTHVTVSETTRLQTQLFPSNGDGATFPTRGASTSSSYQSMGNTTPTVQSAGDGVTFPTRTVDLDSDGLLADRQRWMEEGELDTMANGYGSNQHDRSAL